jgi:hypothetical protein
MLVHDGRVLRPSQSKLNMAVDAIENVAAAEKVHLTRWRMNSYVQKQRL